MQKKLTDQEIEVIRAQRLERAQKRAARRIAWAESNEKKSEQIYNEVTKMSGLIPFGQPILVGHHSEKRHRRMLDKIHNKIGKEIEYDKKAKYHKQKAENILLFSTRVRGDAEREREIKRKEMDEKIKVGQVVCDFAYGAGEVMKINKKTYTLKFKTFTTTRDKTYIKMP